MRSTMGNFAITPVNQVSLVERIMSMEGAPCICKLGSRVAENTMDLKKPSAFQIKNGNDVSMGMLKIIRNPQSALFACFVFSAFFQRSMR